jgi:peptidylprolyl isomerase
MNATFVRWLVPALLLTGCGTPEETPPQPAQETAPAPDAAAPGAPVARTLPPAGSGGPVKPGTTVHFQYKMIVDGEVQMDTLDRGPSTYVQGGGQMFGALEQAMEGMKPGEKKSVTLKPEDAFGPRDETALQVVPKSSFPQPDSIQVGQVLGGMNQGRRVSATVKEVKADEVVLDLNHPLAGKSVTFEVEVISTE